MMTLILCSYTTCYLARSVNVVLAMGAALSMLGLLRSQSPLLELAADGITATASRSGGSTARQTSGEFVGEVSGNTGSGLGVDGQSIPVDVVEGITGQVVAWVGGGAGTGEDTGRGDAELEEADVVRTGAETTEGSGLALSRDVVVDRLGAELVTLVVAKVDVVDGVDGADHIIVPVETDGIGLGFGKLGSVVERSDEAGLLGTPPDEANLVLEAAVLLEGSSNLEKSSGTAAVIVDTGSGLDRVQVSTKNNHVVRVTLLGFRDDVPGLALIPDGINEKVDLEGLASSQTRLPGGGILEGDETYGHQQAQVLSAEGSRANVLARGLVVQNNTNGARGLSELELIRNGADTTLHESKLASGINASPLISEAARAYVWLSQLFS